MPTQNIHPQLLEDCHLLGSLTSGTLLLMRNSALHWLILVPKTVQQDLLDLSSEALTKVMHDCRVLSHILKTRLDYPKVNFAGLGNVVPQMHLHIVGRREGDACWPQPVWGQLPVQADWDSASLESLLRLLSNDAGLQIASSQEGPNK